MYKILVSLDQAMDETEHCLKYQLGVLEQWPKPSAQAQGLRATWWLFTRLLHSNKGICATTGSKQQRFQHLVYPSSLQRIPTPLVAQMLNRGYQHLQEPDTLEKMPTLLLSETHYVFTFTNSLLSCSYRLRMPTPQSPSRTLPLPKCWTLNLQRAVTDKSFTETDRNLCYL